MTNTPLDPFDQGSKATLVDGTDTKPLVENEVIRKASRGTAQGCIIYLVVSLAVASAMLGVLALIWNLAPDSEDPDAVPTSSTTTTQLGPSTSEPASTSSTSTPGPTSTTLSPPTSSPTLTTIATTPLGPNELGPVVKLVKISKPFLPETSDPSVVRVDTQYFVYGSDNNFRAPVTQLTNLDKSYSQFEKNDLTREAMPTAPAWAQNPKQFWAPTVGQFGSQWVMFFGANRRDAPQPNNPQCVGRAFSASPEGPFVPEAQPFTCGIDQVGGALDPEVTLDAQGNPFLLVAFSDTEAPIHSIPLDANANPTGPPVQILARQYEWEKPFIENPSMIFDPSQGSYLLSYSSGDWWKSQYSTGIARCSTPIGPCTSDPSGPWVASAAGRTGPGGMSFCTDTSGAAQAIFASFPEGRETKDGGRSASVMDLKLAPSVRLERATPS